MLWMAIEAGVACKLGVNTCLHKKKFAIYPINIKLINFYVHVYMKYCIIMSLCNYV